MTANNPPPGPLWLAKLATVASADELDGFAAESRRNMTLSARDEQAIATRRAEIARRKSK